MRSRLSFVLLSTTILLLVVKAELYTQSPGELISAQMKQNLRKANHLIDLSRSDSALFYLSPLLGQLNAKKLTQTTFGLSVELALGIAYNNSNRDAQAMRMLNEVRDKSREKNHWEIFVAACLGLAQLHEKLQRSNTAKINLEQAQAAIVQHDLKTAFPAFAVGSASWHLNFGYPDSLKYYALEGIKTSEKFKFPTLAAQGYALMGFYEEESKPRMSIEYHKKAANLLKKIKNYKQLSEQYLNIAGLYGKFIEYRRAILYADSSIAAAYQSIAVGDEKNATLYEAYLYKGTVYNRLGVLDSAIFFATKGWSQKVRFMEQQEHDRVVEVDEKYKDEQKAQQIQAQNQLLKSERQRFIGVLVASCIILLFSVILVYYYLRLQKANRITAQQSQTILETNHKLSHSLEQQIMLQGEIHHRVKNNLQVIISLLELQKEDIKDENTRSGLDAMSSRIYAIAAVHDVLYQGQEEQLVNFLEYTKKLCTHLSQAMAKQNPKFNLQIPTQLFNLDTLIPIGMILNELITNSFKYGYQKDQQLRIDIQLKPAQDGYYLHYQDNGPGFSAGQLKDRTGGLGAYLIRSMVRQLRGQVESKNNGGAMYTIFFHEKNAHILSDTKFYA